MQQAYLLGANAMEVARSRSGSHLNSTHSTEIAYDLQAGSYNQLAEREPDVHAAWVDQVASILRPLLRGGDAILEVGCGDGTTLAGVLSLLVDKRPGPSGGIDISWSRAYVALEHLTRSGLMSQVASADMFQLPLSDGSVDIVFTSHAIEPNGGREAEAIGELLRVTRRYLVLIEPLYEFAGREARSRMEHHGYIRNLVSAAHESGADVLEVRLLDYCSNPNNPSGVILLQPRLNPPASDEPESASSFRYVCPITGAELHARSGCLFAASVGLAYPILEGVPILRPEKAIVASALKRN
jgi:SAM-dependent methyltransferase